MNLLVDVLTVEVKIRRLKNTKFHVFLDVTLRPWLRNCRCFDLFSASTLTVRQSKNNTWPWRWRHWYFETSGNTHPATQYDIQAELNLQRHRWWNLKYHKQNRNSAPHLMTSFHWTPCIIMINPFKPNDPYSGRTAPLTSKRCIFYIYSTNIGTEYFKQGIYSPFFPFQNTVCFIILMYLVPALFTFYIQGVLKLKK